MAKNEIYSARVVHVEAHQSDGCYHHIPEGFRVYLCSPRGDENYLDKSGGFHGNINSDRYAELFVTEEAARLGAEEAFRAIYQCGVDPTYHSQLVWRAEDRSEEEEPAIDDTVRCCPDCERPNQFGELCPSCVRDRETEVA